MEKGDKGILYYTSGRILEGIMKKVEIQTFFLCESVSVDKGKIIVDAHNCPIFYIHAKDGKFPVKGKICFVLSGINTTGEIMEASYRIGISKHPNSTARWSINRMNLLIGKDMFVASGLIHVFFEDVGYYYIVTTVYDEEGGFLDEIAYPIKVTDTKEITVIEEEEIHDTNPYYSYFN